MAEIIWGNFPVPRGDRPLAGPSASRAAKALVRKAGVTLMLIPLCSGLFEKSICAQVVIQPGVLRVKEGEVSYQRPAAPAVSAGVPQPLDFGDQLETAELSWAMVEFPDVSRI